MYEMNPPERKKTIPSITNLVTIHYKILSYRADFSWMRRTMRHACTWGSLCRGDSSSPALSAIEKVRETQACVVVKEAAEKERRNTYI